MNIEELQNGVKVSPMGTGGKFRYVEEGRRLRLLRKAEGDLTQPAFAEKLGWQQSAISMFEKGQRRVPGDKVLEMAIKIPGFDPLWLWRGDKRNLGFDLRSRIEAAEAKECPPKSARNKR